MGQGESYVRSKAKAPSAGSACSIGRGLTLLTALAAALVAVIVPAANAAPAAQPGYRYLTSFGNGGELAGVFINGGKARTPRDR